MGARDRVDGHEADIVPVARVFRARIAETDEEQHDLTWTAGALAGNGCTEHAGEGAGGPYFEISLPSCRRRLRLRPGRRLRRLPPARPWWSWVLLPPCGRRWSRW